MSRFESMLLIILVLLIIVYFSFVSYLIFVVYKNINIINNKEKSKLEEKIDINSEFQTDFFNKSTKHAEKVLFGKLFIQEYGENNYYGNKLMDVISILNDDTKKSIMIAIKYNSIEASLARSNEEMFRNMANQEKVPLWFIILREGTKRVVPAFFQEQVSDNKDNVIPLFKVA